MQLKYYGLANISCFEKNIYYALIVLGYNAKAVLITIYTGKTPFIQIYVNEP